MTSPFILVNLLFHDSFNPSLPETTRPQPWNWSFVAAKYHIEYVISPFRLNITLLFLLSLITVVIGLLLWFTVTSACIVIEWAMNAFHDNYSLSCCLWSTICQNSICMMTSSNGNVFCVTGHLCGEFTGHRWVPRKKASDAELWCFLWFVPD